MNARCSWVGILLVALGGCSTQSEKSYSCTKPDDSHLGPDGMPDPCHEQDADAGVDADADANIAADADAG